MTSYEVDKSLESMKVHDIPINRRKQLSQYLNSEQIIMADSGFARDYRGIGQQLNFSYTQIAQLEKLVDPFGSLLSFQGVSQLSVYRLLQLIATVGRYDILDDMIPLLLQDLQELNSIRNTQNQLLLYEQLHPPQLEETLWYDAYICYADSDLEFVRKLAEHLESPSIGLRLFIRDRDLLGGNWVYETFAQLIETQCRRVVIILSPDFLQCHDCKFQSQFATGLAIEKRSRILIPVIYRHCDLPPMIRLLSKIDMSGGNRNIPQWTFDRLVRSIRSDQQQQMRAIMPPKQQQGPTVSFDDDDSTTNNQPNYQPPELIEISHQSESKEIQNSKNIETLVEVEHSPNFDSITTGISLISFGSNNSTIHNNDEVEDEEANLISIQSQNNSSNSCSSRELSTLKSENNNKKNDKKVLEDSSPPNRKKRWLQSIKRKIKVGL